MDCCLEFDVLSSFVFSLLPTQRDVVNVSLQVREMNLLRESNMQLREENKHNFEECQVSLLCN